MKKILLGLTAALIVGLSFGCGSSSAGGAASGPGGAASDDTTPPTVTSISPNNVAAGVAINRNISATFSEAMAQDSINAASFTVTGPGITPVAGTVTLTDGTSVTFSPTANLAVDATFVATISAAAKDLAGNALTANETWTFTTGSTVASGPAPVNLGTAGDFAILAKSAISTTGITAIVGDIGLSPAARSYVTGFSEALDSSNTFATSGILTGKIYAANMAVPTPAKMTTAISDMQTAYVDAAGRAIPDYTELYSGDISGKTLVPGLYKWGTGVLINSDVTLNGGSDDVWIFQVAKGITQANGTHIILQGGAQAKNVFWQSFGVVAIGTTAHFEGIILAQTQIALNTGASINGRLLAQTAVTLNASSVTNP